MRKLTIGFSKPKNHILPIFSWVIQAYEGLPFSHAFVRWETSVGPGICYHAAKSNIHFLSDRIFFYNIKVVEEFTFEVSDETFNRVMKFCLENCGSSYGILEVFGIPLMDIFKLKKNPFSSGATSQYCAELVLRVLQNIGSENLTFNPDQVKLKQLYTYIKEKHQAGTTL